MTKPKAPEHLIDRWCNARSLREKRDLRRLATFQFDRERLSFPVVEVRGPFSTPPAFDRRSPGAAWAVWGITCGIVARRLMPTDAAGPDGGWQSAWENPSMNAAAGWGIAANVATLTAMQVGGAECDHRSGHPESLDIILVASDSRGRFVVWSTPEICGVIASC
jgi:hypothetical protein